MNTLERAINERLERHPQVKRLAKDCYQFIGSLVPIRDKIPNCPLTVRSGYFFGFHDVCPWSPDGSMLLAHRLDVDAVATPTPDDSLTVGYFQGDDNAEFTPLARTHAFNWQEGSRLQWLGSDIVFNVREGGHKIVGVRLNSRGDVVAKYSFAISAVSQNARFAASYDYGRLKAYDMAYSYAGIAPNDGDAIPSRCGIDIIDVRTGATAAKVSIAELASYETLPSMHNAYHYVSHCQFSPDCARLSFMHCWMVGARRYSRLFSYHLSSARVSSCPAFSWVSHHCWVDNTHILAYASNMQFGRQYYFIDVETGSYRLIGHGILTSDGHPQVDEQGEWLLTDTYPDRYRRQHLVLYNLVHDQKVTLLSVRIPPDFRYGSRCDFHPRWNRDCTAICFDSPHPGTRALCTLPFATLEREMKGIKACCQ